MSRINRIRIMNLNYNGNTIRIDDETFDLNGESTLLSLRNGGGKTVLVQMVTSLFEASQDIAESMQTISASTEPGLWSLTR